MDAAAVETDVKYEGYLARERAAVDAGAARGNTPDS